MPSLACLKVSSHLAISQRFALHLASVSLADITSSHFQGRFALETIEVSRTAVIEFSEAEDEMACLMRFR